MARFAFAARTCYVPPRSLFPLSPCSLDIHSFILGPHRHSVDPMAESLLAVGPLPAPQAAEPASTATSGASNEPPSKPESPAPAQCSSDNATPGPAPKIEEFEEYPSLPSPSFPRSLTYNGVTFDVYRPEELPGELPTFGDKIPKKRGNKLARGSKRAREADEDHVWEAKRRSQSFLPPLQLVLLFC
jgi:hypothetical protein